MILNPAAQHREKHFQQLLTRELAYIERGHKQNLITYERLEKTIYRDSNQITHIKQKKIPIPPIDEDFNRHSEKSNSSIVGSSIINSTTISSQSTVDGKTSQIFSKYYRHCFKAQRLPALVKLNRKKRTNNDLHWIGSLQSANIGNETFTLMDDELPKMSLPESTAVQKQIHSFMETLPIYKGVQKGFDNFAPSSLYSTRAPVVMR